MFAQMTQVLVDAAAGLLVYALLARFHFQWLRVPFRNPIGQFVIAFTDWAVRPARRVVPTAAGLDLPTLAVAWLVQALALSMVRALGVGEATLPAPGPLAFLAALDLLRYSLYLLFVAVLVQVVLSWLNPYAPIAPLFEAMTRPFLRPLRRLLPLVANVDLSPLALLVALQVILVPIAQLRAQLLAWL